MQPLQSFTLSISDSNDDVDESTDMFLDEDLNDESVTLPQYSGSISSFTQDAGKRCNTNNPHELTVFFTGLTSVATLQFLKDKHTTDVDLRRAEVEVQEKKIALAEKEFKLAREKFDLEKQERLRRLELEQQERTMHLKVLEQQQKLIQMFFDQHKC